MFQNKFKSFALFIGLTLLTQKSQAAFVITPSVGYKTQTAKFTNNSDTETEFKASNPVYGLSLGYLSASGVSLDILGTYVSGKVKTVSLGVEQELDLTEQSAAAQLGISTRTFKIYLGYVLMNENTIKQTAFDVSFKGPGYQAGFVFYLTNSIALGIQYQIDQYNQVKISNQSSSFEDIKLHFKKIDSQSTTLNLSYRF
jgi:hypothetical protein